MPEDILRFSYNRIADLLIKNGEKSLFAVKAKPGETKTAKLEIKLEKWSRINFIAHVSDSDKAKISIKPAITLKNTQGR